MLKPAFTAQELVKLFVILPSRIAAKLYSCEDDWHFGLSFPLAAMLSSEPFEMEAKILEVRPIYAH